MRQHEVDKKQYGKLRHPQDAEAWKAFDLDFPAYAANPRNVGLLWRPTILI